MVSSISEQSPYVRVLLFKVKVYALPLMALQIAATVKNPPPPANHDNNNNDNINNNCKILTIIINISPMAMLCQFKECPSEWYC